MSRWTTPIVHWNYRVVKRIHKHGEGQEVLYYIHEAYYDEGEKISITTDATKPCGESIDDLRQRLQWMLAALDKPILNYEDY